MKNKPNEWEEELNKRWSYFKGDYGIGNYGCEKIEQFIRQLLTKELAKQKHDFDILVDTILDKHKSDIGKMVERIEKMKKEDNNNIWSSDSKVYSEACDDIIKIIKKV